MTDIADFDRGAQAAMVSFEDGIKAESQTTYTKEEVLARIQIAKKNMKEVADIMDRLFEELGL